MNLAQPTNSENSDINKQNGEVIKGELVTSPEQIPSFSSFMSDDKSQTCNYFSDGWQNTAKKFIEQNLKFLNDLYSQINLIRERKEALEFQQNLNDFQMNAFIENVHSLNNSTIRFFELLQVKLWKKTQTDTKIYFRINPFGKREKINSDDDIRNLILIPIKIYNTIEEVRIYDNTLILVKSLLPIIKDDIFYPYINAESILDCNITYRNTFQYSIFLSKRNLILTKVQLQNQLSYNTSSNYPPLPFTYNYLTPWEIHDINQQLSSIDIQLQKSQSFIENFIRTLSQNEYQFNYIMRWLAHFFQNLTNGKLALVLIGDKKTTDIIVEDILKPIFATKDEYFSVIDNETLKKSNDYLLKDKIFYHFDNLASSNTRDSKICELIFEIFKAKTPNNIENYMGGGVLVTSSEDSPYPFLKDIYSICSIFKVKHFDTILKKMNIDRISLNQSIKDDLDNFSNILAQYTLQKEYYHIADTSEKQALSSMKNGILKTPEIDTQIEQFIIAIRTKELFYFSNLEKENIDLYKELKENFKNNMIAQPLLSEYFNIVHSDKIFSDNSLFLEILKEKAEMFKQTPDDKSKYNGKKRYKISNINQYTKPEEISDFFSSDDFF